MTSPTSPTGPEPGRPAPPPGPAQQTTPGTGPVAPTTPGAAPGQPGQPGRPAKDPTRGSKAGGLWAALVAFGVILVLLVVFIAQNTDTTTVEFLGFEGETPLAVALLVATAAGILLTALVGSLRIAQLKHRARKDAKRR
ncbi:DUF1049 domain-containing protein [Nocardioides sp. ChNu-153]|uniref:LapA family protein n=1 Tax=unclassified Nocardioides TaxID=2615069 RepID=UPI0024066181|nr:MULTISPECIES: lipopolysaccharide assembly protein LapA domain-containing protein [unclassified Nocardioides]MDF9714795.1 DUF1049 domain-containing protein [Nocardioides sp. ChNu-99]MDN7120079.1 DUF1049 domain-containing protein [Nocardioides sp. ChNu-153]